MTDHTTEYVRFDRLGDSLWRIETQQRSGKLTIDVRMEFTRAPNQPIWGAERLAIQQAHALLEEWLRSQPARAEPSGPDT
ncbi:MAG: hypothetical protein DYH17_15560 [Xanthomonadales bacterium PRO6]|nr:hypothetical protein [Xanthomonadales bacterium]MCE7932776.1 hypothetical protein [Xanthomonadales bacterium PRO6]